MKELIGSLMTYEINLAKKLQEGEDKKKKSITLQKLQLRIKKKLKKKNKVKKITIYSSSQKSSTNTWGVKGLEVEGSPLEETFLKRNFHLMVTKRNGKGKKIWCASNAKNWDTLNMIILSTKVKPRGEKKKAMMTT